ncbi:MAG: LysM peptidoglycan-binding domain-containing protein [Eubacterium sp.]|nr:LysM peptidoglycan-binding domain-containing protein [Eubacterium sp.]
MIEIIQQTEKNEEMKLPKNIRQIGNPEKDFRIYMEDYVYTYLHPAQLFYAEELLPRLLILVGEINHFANRSCAFICGAIQVENNVLSEELPVLNDDTWRRVHKELQHFFGNSEVVGWVLDIPGNELQVTEEMEQVHRENFVSPYQFFFLMDSKEREEAFYIWKGSCLVRKEGYFIYYEKNPGMQEYMISKREAALGEKTPTEYIEDRAARHYRTMIQEKKEHTCKTGTGLLSYLSSLLMVIILCTVSVMLLGNIRRMEHMEQTISVMSDVIESTEQEKQNDRNQVSVETINGSVFPLEDSQAGAVAEGDLPDDIQLKEDAADALARLDEEKGTDEMGEPAETEAALQKKTPEDEEQAADTTTVSDGEAQAEEPVVSAEPPVSESNEATSANQTVQSEADLYREQGYYIVQEGDNLRGICYKIYQTYSMMGPLCEANVIEDQDYIYAGQKLVLP